MAFLWSRFVTRRNLSEVSPVHGPAGSGWWPVSSGTTTRYPVPAGSLATTGLSPAFSQVIVTKYSVPVAAMVVTAQAPKLRLRWGVPTASAAITALAPALRWKVGYQVPAKSASLTAYAPDFKSVMRFAVPIANVSVSAFTPTVRTRFGAQPRALALAGVAPAFKSVMRFAIPSRALALAGVAPALRMLVTTRYAIPDRGLAFTTALGTFRLRHGVPVMASALAGQVPVFKQVQKWILHAAAAIVLTASAPSFRHIFRAPASGAQITGLTPELRSIRRFPIPVAAVSVTAQTPKLRTIYRPGVNYLALSPRIPAFRSVARHHIPTAVLTLSSSVVTFTVRSSAYEPTRTISWNLAPRSTAMEDTGVLPMWSLSHRSTMFTDNAPVPRWDLAARSLQGEAGMAITRFSKDPGERLTIGQNFAKRLQDRTIVSASASISQLEGASQTQPEVDAILDGAVVASAGSTWVMQRVKDGVLGCSYLVKLKATLSDGDILVGSTQIDIQLGA